MVDLKWKGWVTTLRPTPMTSCPTTPVSHQRQTSPLPLVSPILVRILPQNTAFVCSQQCLRTWGVIDLPLKWPNLSRKRPKETLSKGPFTPTPLHQPEVHLLFQLSCTIEYSKYLGTVFTEGALRKQALDEEGWGRHPALKEHKAQPCGQTRKVVGRVRWEHTAGDETEVAVLSGKRR